jgi:hypothetical protein
MKEIFLQTSTVLRGRPMLWLPVVCAAILSYCWTQLGAIVSHGLLRGILTTQSVLGGTVSDTSPLRVATSYVVGFLAKSSFQYADVCCFVIALLVTAKICGQIPSKNPVFLPYADISIANYTTAVLRFGLLAYLLAYASMALVLAASVYFLQRARELTQANQLRFPILAAACMYGMLAYFLSPAAMRLLRVARDRSVTANEIATARKCSLWAGAAMTLLSTAQILVPRPIESTLPERIVMAVFWSVLVALPYAPLFVSLSLVAAGYQPTRGSFASLEDDGERQTTANAN